MSPASDTPTLVSARQVLHNVEGISDLHPRGYLWLRNAFLPALRRLSRSRHSSDRIRTATGYYLLGDVHDFNHAPRAAIRAYRRCLQFNPGCGAALREIGSCYDEVGDRRRALFNLRKAVQVDPSDVWARGELQSVEDVAIEAFYKPGDPYWQCRELLAMGRPMLALECICGTRTLDARTHRARIYGALGDVARGFHEWRGLLNGASTFDITDADWFYLPPTLWHEPDFWRLLWKGRARVADWGVIRGHEDLRDMGLCGKRRMFELFLRYRLARTRRDTSAAQKLSEKYPSWREAATLSEQLGGSTV